MRISVAIAPAMVKHYMTQEKWQERARILGERALENTKKKLRKVLGDDIEIPLECTVETPNQQLSCNTTLQFVWRLKGVEGCHKMDTWFKYTNRGVSARVRVATLVVTLPQLLTKLRAGPGLRSGVCRSLLRPAPFTGDIQTTTCDIAGVPTKVVIGAKIVRDEYFVVPYEACVRGNLFRKRFPHEMMKATLSTNDITINHDENFQVAQAMDVVKLVTAVYAEKARAKAENRDMNPDAYENFTKCDPWWYSKLNDGELVVVLSSRVSEGRKIEDIRLTNMSSLMQIVRSIARDN